ncbi:MAG: hypothetical protein AAF750_15530 [Planctomycetota bacterium]
MPKDKDQPTPTPSLKDALFPDTHFPFTPPIYHGLDEDKRPVFYAKHISSKQAREAEQVVAQEPTIAYNETNPDTLEAYEQDVRNFYAEKVLPLVLHIGLGKRIPGEGVTAYCHHPDVSIEDVVNLYVCAVKAVRSKRQRWELLGNSD